MRERKKSGTKAVEKRLFIFCEGAKDKSESAYFKSLIKDCRLPAGKVDVQVIDTNKNTGRELVNTAKKFREFEDDILWIVYDKDSYTLHAETFDNARRNNVNIAFSSISFEYWILLHLKDTTRSFTKSEEVIRFIEKECDFHYSKKSADIYSLTKKNIETAISRAERLQKIQEESDIPVYDYNPYTDIDKLIKDIKSLCDK